MPWKPGEVFLNFAEWSRPLHTSVNWESIEIHYLDYTVIDSGAGRYDKFIVSIRRKALTVDVILVNSTNR